MEYYCSFTKTMNNTPDGFYMTGENDTHYPACEDQPEGAECICEGINMQMDIISDESAIEEKIFAYNREVSGVILEGIRL